MNGNYCAESKRRSNWKKYFKKWTFSTQDEPHITYNEPVDIMKRGDGNIVESIFIMTITNILKTINLEEHSNEKHMGDNNPHIYFRERQGANKDLKTVGCFSGGKTSENGQLFLWERNQWVIQLKWPGWTQSLEIFAIFDLLNARILLFWRLKKADLKGYYNEI